MTEDASLDEFLDAGSEAADEEPGQKGEGEDEQAPEAARDDDAKPPEREDPGLSTYDWSPGGAPCAACGAVVERRWRDDTELVCESCKEW